MLLFCEGNDISEGGKKIEQSKVVSDKERKRREQSKQIHLKESDIQLYGTMVKYHIFQLNHRLGRSGFSILIYQFQPFLAFSCSAVSVFRFFRLWLLRMSLVPLNIGILFIESLAKEQNMESSCQLIQLYVGSMATIFMCLFILYDSIICIFHNDFLFCLLGTHTHISHNWRTIHKAHFETHLMVDLQQMHVTITHTQRKTYLRTVPLFLVEADHCYDYMDII